MKYYSDMNEEQFISYVENHSSSERALFNKDQVAQMLELVGYTDKAIAVKLGIKKWYSVDMRNLIEIYNTKKIVDKYKL